MRPELLPGMVVITQGDVNSIVSQSIRWASKSWWTHCFIVLDETEGLEAIIPTVHRMNIQDRFEELKRENRDYIVMDLPNITMNDRQLVVEAALEFEYQFYDWLGCLWYVVFKTWLTGVKSMVCSRLMTAPFYDALGIRLFEWSHLKLPHQELHRRRHLIKGYCSPDEIFRYSELEVIYRS